MSGVTMIKYPIATVPVRDTSVDARMTRFLNRFRAMTRFLNRANAQGARVRFVAGSLPGERTCVTIYPSGPAIALGYSAPTPHP